MKKRLRAAFECLKAETGKFVPQIAVIPGSGWDHIAQCLQNSFTVSYSGLPDFPQATFHKGVFTFGEINGIKTVLAGRLHFYEGFSADEVVMPLRLLRMLGTETLLLTNASGGIDPAFAPGSFMVIKDHIKLNVPSPLRGENMDFLGPRFPDMSHIYSERLQSAIFRAGERCGIALHSGIYLQTAGPQFETPAEIRMMRAMGADAVGMSTAAEAVAAVHCGMEVAGISCISNLAAGLSREPLSVEDITAIAEKSAPQMRKLLQECIIEFSKTDE